MDRQLSPLLVRMVEKMDAAVLVTGPELDEPGPSIVYVNDAFCRQTGYPREDLIGRNPRLFQGPRTQPHTLRELRSTLERGEDFAGETWNYRKDGTEYRVRWYIQNLRDDSGEISHFFAVQEDVTVRAGLLRDLLGLARASYDGLSLPGFAQLLEMERKTCRVRAQRGGETGYLYFRDGKLVDAILDSLGGLDAALEIFRWARAEIELEPMSNVPTGSIDESLQFVLIEAARTLDEARREGGASPRVGASSDEALTALDRWLTTESLETALDQVRLSGALGVALLDSAREVVIASSGHIKAVDLEQLAAANSHFVRHKNRLLAVLGLQDELEDIVVTHVRNWHVLRPLKGSPDLCLFAVYPRTRVSLTKVRQGLAEAAAVLR